MHSRVLSELAHVFAKPVSMVLEKSWQSGEVLVTGKRETLHPFLKRVEKKTPGATDLLASPQCLGRSWNRSS